MSPRRLVAASAALLLAAGLAAAPAASGQVAAPVAVRDGGTVETSVFPSDRFTVADSAQLTGRRVALPVPTCTEATRSLCDAVRVLNTADGFDLQPRFFLPFTGDVDVATVTPESVYVEGPAGRVGLQELTFDPSLDLLAGTVRAQLPEQTRHVLVITRLVRGADGRPLAAEVRVPFTTMSGTTELARLRAALDDGSAYAAAGITNRAASFVQPNPGDRFSPITSGTVTTVFPALLTTENLQRNDQRTTSTDAATFTSSKVPNLALAAVGCYAFGSFETPLFARDDSTIAPTPTTQTPPVQGKARTGFALVVPAGTPPAGGWPVAVYGPGFTRSYFDLFVSADLNAAAGIATIATNPLGHGFGPASTITVQGPGTRFLSYGRGKDLTGDGRIEAAEGSQPAIAVSNDGGEGTVTPSPNQVHGLRGGLMQTVVDNMALVRAVEGGMDVPSCPAADLPGPGNPSAPDGVAPLSRDVTRYYGLSFGGIYGTMLMGTDPSVTRGLLNVGGGPITDIARLSGFRPLVADILEANRPNLLNGGPGRDGFTESWPLPHDPPITDPVPGAMEIQRTLAYSLWYGRPGGPETYAPLLRPAGKDVLYQVAFGDNTVPNVTSGNIVRAGGLLDRTTYYRNDQTPTRGTNPHGFLADPTVFGRQQGQLQMTTFLATGQVVDPDGPLPVFEVPIANPDDLQCLHYPHPQTGQGAFGQDGGPAASGPCPARPADAQLQPVDDGAGPAAPGGGSTAAPVRGSRALAATGAPVLLPLLGLLALGGGLALRRRGR